MKNYPFDFNIVHSSWQACVKEGLQAIDENYLIKLSQSVNWLPGPDKIFNAFSIPINKVNFILFGESPYPRKLSANGYAFWDAAVKELWTSTGLSKKVNRATSLRNFIKMLLVAEGYLDKHVDQASIAQIKKKHLVNKGNEFFENFLLHGFLLLNASLVLQPNQSPLKDVKAWQPFFTHVLEFVLKRRPKVKLLLFGKGACYIEKVIAKENFHILRAEHPYNHSFITNPEVIAFFKPLHLLKTKRNN